MISISDRSEWYSKRYVGTPATERCNNDTAIETDNNFVPGLIPGVLSVSM